MSGRQTTLTCGDDSFAAHDERVVSVMDDDESAVEVGLTRTSNERQSASSSSTSSSSTSRTSTHSITDLSNVWSMQAGTTAAATTSTALSVIHNTTSKVRIDVHESETETPKDDTEANHQNQTTTTTLTNATSTAPATASTTAATLPVDQERQVLLLMLLGQVCALHDPTPQTFTVHVLELVERGLLEKAAVSFLYDLGLVPSHNNSSSSATATSTTAGTGTLQHQQHPVTVPHSAPTTPTRRSASTATAASTGSTVQEHPLTLSRYQRDFRPLHAIASGSFGSVVAAVNALDGATYAVKRVVVSTVLGSADTVLRTILREVQCIAQCDHHPHVVRYYTAWLEPSWMTGDMTTTTASRAAEQPPLLLTQGNHTDGTSSASLFGNNNHQYPADYSSAWTNNNTDTSSVMSDWFHHEKHLQQQYPILSPSTALVGINGDDNEPTSDSLFDRSDCSAWDDDTAVPSAEEGSYQYGSVGAAEPTSQQHPISPTTKNKRNGHQHRPYRYEVCLYIQMQLCDTTTLLDWMRAGPHDRSVVRRVVRDIASGLDHIHKCGIVHRDIKPANIFRHSTETEHFLIGDFGLSTIVQQQQQQQSGPSRTAAAATSRMPSTAHTSNGWHTAGVGTATYAAPEQVATRKYGPSADIFSFGLILLELCAPNPMTTTDHERLEVMGNVRHRRVVPETIRRNDPFMAALILDCTTPSPELRPSANDILKRLQDEESETSSSFASSDRKTNGVSCMKDHSCSDEQKQNSSPSVLTRVTANGDDTKEVDGGVASLRRRVETLEMQVTHYKTQLAERDAKIVSLQQQLQEGNKR